jgi:hypothetical protein
VPPRSSICFECTPALLAFRQAAGDANRFLNTLLVALETLKSSTPIRPIDLVVPWTFPHAEKEWTDTRNFALKGAMVAVVDGLDQYMRVLSRVAGLVASELDNILNGRRDADRGRRLTVAERLEALCAAYPGVVRAEYLAAMQLLVLWRNGFVHSDYRFRLALPTRKVLVTAEHFFQAEHGGAGIVSALSRFEQQHPPTLTDLSTLISSAHRIARGMDEHLLQLQNAQAYAFSLMQYLIMSNTDPQAFLESTWLQGGRQSVGRIHAMFLAIGGNHDDNRRANAPAVSRAQLHNLFAFGRNRASEVFGVPRKRHR